MLEKYFKKYSESFAKPFIKILKIIKVKPNTVSIAGVVVILFGSYFFYLGNIFVAFRKLIFHFFLKRCVVSRKDFSLAIKSYLY